MCVLLFSLYYLFRDPNRAVGIFYFEHSTSYRFSEIFGLVFQKIKYSIYFIRSNMILIHTYIYVFYKYIQCYMLGFDLYWV